MSCRWLKHIQNKQCFWNTANIVKKNKKKYVHTIYKKVEITVVGHCKVITSLPFLVSARRGELRLTGKCYNNIPLQWSITVTVTLHGGNILILNNSVSCW